MPRTNDPAGIPVGPGLAADDSVEANALLQPTLGTDGLRVHITDPSRAHMASAVGIVDAGGFYSSDQVEGALQEVGGGGAASHANGLISVGTWTSVGLVLTLDAGTTILVNGIVRDFAGVTVTLLDNQTQYVYVNPATGLLTRNLVAPTLATEPIWISEVTTAAGVVTSSRDARFFVPNIERKPPLTLRGDGAAINAHSEGCFETLTAAFFYLETYGGTGSSEVETHTLTVRGAITVSSTFQIPVDGFILEGDGDASFLTGGALVPMFDLNGKDNVQFRNLTFRCQHAVSTAIQDTSGPSDSLVVENCTFSTGAAAWQDAIDLQDNSDTNLNHVIRDVVMVVSSTGLTIARHHQCHVENVTVTGTAGTGTAGIYLDNTTGSEGRSTITGCTVDGYATGYLLSGTDINVSECNGYNARTALAITAGSRNRISNSTFVVNAPNTAVGGYDGIHIESTHTKVKGCSITNPRASWVGYPALDTRGVHFVAGATDGSVEDCTIAGFYNDSGPLGYGVFVEGTSDRCTVQGGNITNCYIGVSGSTAAGADADQVSVQGTTFNGVAWGVFLRGTACSASGLTIDLDSLYGLVGIEMAGNDARVENCTIVNSRAAGVYGIGDVPTGIKVGLAAGLVNATIVGCECRNFLNTVPAPDTGYGIHLNGTIVGALVSGCQVVAAGVGYRTESTASRVTFTGCKATDVVTGAEIEGPDNSFLDGEMLLDLNIAQLGVSGVMLAATATNAKVSDCTLRNLRSTWGAEVSYGVSVLADNATVSNCRIDGFFNTSAANGIGVYLNAEAPLIEGNTITDEYYGVFVEANHDHAKVINNTFLGATLMREGIHVAGVSGSPIRDVDLSGNTVVSCALRGIYVEGDVFYGTIANNVVDMYIPADAYNPTADGIVLAATATATPTGLIVEGNKVRRCASGILAIGLIAERITDITFANNRVTHCGYAQDLTTSGIPDTFAGRGSKGIGLEFCTGIKVTGNGIKSIGYGINDAGTADWPDQGALVVDVQAKGIYARNCSRVTVEDNDVEDCIGTGTLGYSDDIYLEMRSAGAGGTVDTLQIVANDNRVYCDAAPALAGNNGPPRHGIYLEVATGTDGAPITYNLDGVVINDNTIRQVQNVGIRVRAGDNAVVRQVSIKDNTIDTVAAGAAGDSELSGIVVETFHETLVAANAEMQEVAVEGNNIRETDEHGIYFTAAKDGVFSGMSARNNTITGCGGAGVWAEVGTAALALDFTRFDVTDNQITVTGVGSNDDGIFLRPRGLLSGITIADNNIVVPAGSGRPLHINADYVGTAVSTDYHEDITIVDNTFVGGVGSLVSLNGAGAGTSGPRIRNLTVDENTFQSANVGLNFEVLYVTAGSDQVITNLGFDNNTFQDCLADGLRVVIGNATEAVEGVRNLSIAGNRLAQCQTNAASLFGSAIFVQMNSGLENLSILDNRIADVDAATLNSQTTGTIHLLLGHPAGLIGYNRNLEVRGNQLRNCQSVGVLIEDYGSAADWGVEGLKVVENEIYNQTNDGIRVDLSAFTLAAAVEVDRNVIQTVGPAAASDSGIWFGSPTGADLLETSVSGNVIANTAALGMYVYIQSIARGLSVDGNRINTTVSDGLGVRVDDYAIGLSVDHNKVRSPGQHGIYVVISGDVVGNPGLRNGSINHNTVNDSGAQGVYLWPQNTQTAAFLRNVDVSHNHVEGVNVGGSDYEGITIGTQTGHNDGGFENVTVSHNTTYNTSASGIAVFNGGGVEGLVLQGNQVHSAGGTGGSTAAEDNGIRVHLDGATARNINVSGNTTENTWEEGIRVWGETSASFQSVSVCNNTVRNWAMNGAALSWGVQVRCHSGASRAVTVSHNTMYGISDFSGGLNLDFGAEAVDGLTVHGNTGIIPSTATNTQSMGVQWGAGSEVISFVGNTFKDFVTGVTFTAGVQANYGTVSANVERIAGPAAGNWLTAVTGFYVTAFVGGTSSETGLNIDS